MFGQLNLILYSKHQNVTKDLAAILSIINILTFEMSSSTIAFL